jgi:hypothetical protein
MVSAAAGPAGAAACPDEAGVAATRDESTTMLATALAPRKWHAAEIQRQDQQHIAESERPDALTRDDTSSPKVRRS